MGFGQAGWLLGSFGVTTLWRFGLAVAVVLLVARGGSSIAAMARQPPVIGQLVLCLALGPSVVGAIAPSVTIWLFPDSIRSQLSFLGEIGVVIFMFFVVADLADVRTRHRHVLAAVVATGVASPFIFGTLAAILLLGADGGDGARAWESASFIGIALAATAVPVLAAILEEASLPDWLGDLAVSSAAGTDAIVWGMLALLAGVAGRQSLVSASLAVSVVLLLTASTFAVVRPLVQREAERYPLMARAHLIPIVGLGFAAAFSIVTNRFGFTPIFGAFLAGLVFRGLMELPPRWSVSVRQLNRTWLLPILFVSIGLKADVHGYGSWPRSLATFGLFLTIVLIGKLGGVALAAHGQGLGWRDALGLGVLLNTKGLTEIVILNVGIDLHFISRGLLAILIFVAIVTTLLTMPIVRALGLAASRPRAEASIRAAPDTPTTR